MRLLSLTPLLFLITLAVQSQPKTSPDDLVEVTKKEFKSLDWVTGTWRGTGGDEPEPFYERYEFIDENTIRFITYGDSAMTEQNSVGEITLSNNVITYESGDFVWKATSLEKGKIEFGPWDNVNNSFVWTKISEGTWKAVLIYPRKNQPDKKVTYLLKSYSS